MPAAISLTSCRRGEARRRQLQAMTVSATAVSLAKEIVTLAVDGTDTYAVPAGQYVGQEMFFITISAANAPVCTLTGTFIGGTTISAMGAVGRQVHLTWLGASWAPMLGPSVTIA